MAWLLKCKEMGITKAWISIDGSNNDCEVKESDLSEFGYAKSHNNSKIVSFIYAVNAEDGTPITYFVHPGSVVDSKAFMEIAALLKNATIEIEGVILDSGFCSYEVIQTIVSQEYDYVILTPCDTYGHTALIKAEGQNIKWKSRFCVSDEELIYGTSRKHVLFGNHSDLESYINLYFDAFRGTRNSSDLTLKIRKERRRVQGQIDQGKKATVKDEFSPYLQIKKIDGKDTIIPNHDLWDSRVEKKGFFSIASSQDYGAERTLQIYHLRDASETGFCILKSQQGFSTTRVHSTAGIESKFAICFIGNIIRNQILLACKSLGLDTNVMLQKLDRIYLRKGTSNSYYDVKMISGDFERLYSAFDIKPEDFKDFAEEVNKRRNTPVSNNIFLLPKHEAPIKTRIPGKRGRPKGSKNKKTLEKEKAIEAMILSGIDPSELNPKKPVGRPKGARDSTQRKRRTKAEIEAANVS